MAFDVRRAAREEGCFAIRHPLFPAERCAEALALGHSFFALPTAGKEAVSIAGSAHFRGYSEMKNERDWREQIHFGREEAAGTGPAYRQLSGPNRWPDGTAWRGAVLDLMRDLECVGREILAELGAFLPEAETPYVLLKMIHYHASPGGAARPGVAAHVDFSWITLLLQDGTGGLEYCTPGGEWRPSAPEAGTIVVNLGEILQFATGGYYQATPHRVITSARPRLSMPFFLNPSLERVVRPDEGTGHVHRVLRERPLHFGEEEWKRKGMGIWCGTAACRGVA